MSSYNNFQTGNAKNSVDRTDIYNSDFESPIAFSDSDFIGNNIDKWAELISFLRWYPDIAYDLIMPEKGKRLVLDTDQRVALRMLVRGQEGYMCVIRGWGKTMIHVMAHYHVARYFPGANLAITASTRESATNIWKAKHDELLEFFPSLADEIKVTSFQKDTGKVTFVNGSNVASLANSQQSKGLRKHRGGLEESNIIDKITLEDAVLPIFNIPRRTLGNEIDPEELNSQINRYTTSGFKNSDEYDVIKGVLGRQTEGTNGSFLIGSDWILPVYFGRQKKSVIDKARRGSLTSFKQNYLCEWVGSTTGSLMNVSVLMRNRSLDRPVMECEKDKRGKDLDLEYVLICDVARSASDSNNKSAMGVLKIIRSKSGEVRQVQLMKIDTPPNGLTFTEQSVLLKRMFYAFGGNIDSVDKSKVKAIVIDANVIGQGLVDEMVKNTTDPLTNKELGSFGTINTNQESDDPSAEPFLYCLKSQGINGAIITNFLDYCESDKFKMVKQFSSIVDGVKDSERIDVEIACRQVDEFIDEVANLQRVETKSSITVKQVVKKIDKDRYSAISYGLYYIDMYMNSKDEALADDDDPLVYY